MMAAAGFLFSVCGEKTPDNGEDSFVYALNESRAMVGVFDGGSAGAKPALLKGKSGGYFAARAAAGAYLRWFESLEPEQEASARDAEELVKRCLQRCREAGGDAPGAWTKALSAAAAVALCRLVRGAADVQLQWAGDARVYLLDGQGLAQLTEDDPGGIDAMESLSGEKTGAGGLSLDGDLTIHTGRLTTGRPCLLFAATNGCFDHFSTPMEFEYLLLSTLQSAPNAESWEKKLSDSLRERAKEDCCISGIALNAGNFDELKRQLAGRTSQVYRTYIYGLETCSGEEKLQLWEHYKDHYHRLLCRV